MYTNSSVPLSPQLSQVYCCCLSPAPPLEATCGASGACLCLQKCGFAKDNAIDLQPTTHASDIESPADCVVQ